MLSAAAVIVIVKCDLPCGKADKSFAIMIMAATVDAVYLAASPLQTSCIGGPDSSQYVFANLTLVLLNPDIPCFANNVDPDQLASEEAN